jgi:hypothetical protein
MYLKALKALLSKVQFSNFFVCRLLSKHCMQGRRKNQKIGGGGGGHRLPGAHWILKRAPKANIEISKQKGHIRC